MRGNHYWSVYSLKSSTVTANKIKDAIVSSWQRCNTNMSAHVIFDPMDHLVFLHCDQEFERFLLQSNGFQESPWPPLPAQTEEEVRNLITLHLTPHVSVNRQLAQSLKHLESMADTCVAHQTWQQFVFLELCRDGHTRKKEEQGDDGLHMFLQRKVALFSRTTRFLFGNALYSINKYEHNMKMLFKLIAKWSNINLEIPFLIESIEKLFLGFHMEMMQKELILQVERLIKLQMNKLGVKEVRETPTCYLVLFKDKLLYKHESELSRLSQEDMLSVYLLTRAVQLYPGPGSDVSSECSNLDDSVTGERMYSHFQQLVFLSSTYNCQIPVPHIYRKVMVTEDLCFVSLSELPSLLMISIPTLLQSVAELQLDLNLHKSLKSIENLTNCVRNLHRYITKHVMPIMSPHQTFNLGPFEQLADLARKASHSPSELVYEQADRILTLVWSRLQEYGEVAFKHLYHEEFPQHMQIYDQNVAHKMSDLLQDKLSTCIDYIQVKYDTSHLVISLAVDYCPSLETMLFLDRSTGHFVMGSLEGNFERVTGLLSSVVLQAYQRRENTNKCLDTWSDDHYRFAYFYHPLERNGPSQMINQLDSSALYEAFFIFKESSLNAEFLCQANIEKLIKVYINR